MLYVRVLPTAITDISSNPPIEMVLLISNITLDMSSPVLLSFDLNLNDSLLTLRFSEAVFPQSLDAFKVTILSQPGISASIQLRIDRSSRFYTSDFDSTVHIVLTRNDHDFLIDSSRPIAKSIATTFMFIEAGAVYNYAGLPSLALSAPLPVENYFEGGGKYSHYYCNVLYNTCTIAYSLNSQDPYHSSVQCLSCISVPVYINLILWRN